MSENTFKKSVYISCAVAIVLVSYLAFARKLGTNDSATARNAKYLGLKANPSVDVTVGNQKDLTLDGSGDDTKGADADSQQSTTTAANGKLASLYTVKEGDTYGCIAETYYGSFEHWQDILNANSRYGNGFSEYHLHVGAVLELPAISAENLKPASKLCS